MRILPIVFIVALVACSPEPEGEPIQRTEIGSGVAEQTATPEPEAPARTSACRDVTFEGAKFTHCTADPAKHRITTDLGPDDGSPYRSLPNLAGGRPAKAALVAFAMNGGMYDGEGKPIGYYVEGGERLKELSRNDGPGNFHMKPNGVFYGTGDKWAVRTSDDFYSNVGDRPQDNTPIYTVPEGQFFFMGDNRDNSTDSRVAQSARGVGFVPRKDIVGRADRVMFSSAGRSMLYFWTWRSDRFFKKIE